MIAIFASLFLTLSACEKVQASGEEEIADETMRYYKIYVTRFDCSVDGDRAVVKATNVIEARIWGSHGTWTLNGTTYLRRADNKYGWVRCNPE